MVEKMEAYVSYRDIRDSFREYNVYIWGTGEDAVLLCDAVGNDINIICFVDNYRNNTTFQKKNVINKTAFFDIFSRDQKGVLIIATYKYGKEILEKLDEGIFRKGENTFLLDEQHVFIADQNALKYINFNKKIWMAKKRIQADNQIMISFRNLHNGMPIIYSYFANWFAEKYNARIVAYSGRGISMKNASKVLQDIYESFNTSEFIDFELDKEQISKAESIVESIWKNIETWEDWNKIKVFGIQFGTTIIRDMNRFFLPEMNPRSEQNKTFLFKSVQTIVFWNDYFSSNNVKTVLMKDGVTWEGYIREIALNKGIPVYALQGETYFRKLYHNFCLEPYVVYYKKFWDELSADEKNYGMEWAKEHIKKRLAGSEEDIPYLHGKSTFAQPRMKGRCLNDSNAIKVLICPHIFEEESYECGEQIFDNNYLSWLIHIGQLSEEIDDYEWYIKMHPNGMQRDRIILDKFLGKYNKITEIPVGTSPLQLKDEGLSCVLTVFGIVGHEYAAIGIPVICAGVNYHSAFDFTRNPKTKEEFDDEIHNIKNLSQAIRKEEIYQFYAIHYLYYQMYGPSFVKDFYKKREQYMTRDWLRAHGMDHGTWEYATFMDYWTRDWHDRLYEKIDDMVTIMDEWKPNIFYRKR